MKVDYDLLAIDLDGTLLGRNGQVSPRNFAALRAARDAGLEVVIATGRALVESSEILASIEHEGMFVGAGGALLCDAATGRTIDRAVMERSVVEAIASSLLSHGHLAHLLKDSDVTGYEYLIVGEGALDRATQWWFDTLPVRARFVASMDDDPHPDETVRCGTVATAAALGAVAKEIRDDLGDSIFLQHWSAVTSTQATGSGTHLLEAFNPDVDKWTMLGRYASRRGILPERIAAIGDGLNDIRMVENAGLGIAVGNADAGVLHVADEIVANHDQDGVAQAIDRILDSRW